MSKLSERVQRLESRLEYRERINYLESRHLTLERKLDVLVDYLKLKFKDELAIEVSTKDLDD